MRLVTELYGGGLARVVELVGAERARRAATSSLDDELVASLLLVHGLHPDGLGSRVEAALDERAAVPRPARRRRRADRHRRGGRGRAAAAARQLRRLPVVGGDAPAGGRAGHPGGRARDRDHRRGATRASSPAPGPPRRPGGARPQAGLRLVPRPRCWREPASRWPCSRASGRRRRGRRPEPERAVRAVRRADPPGARPPRRPRRPAACCAPAAAATCCSPRTGRAAAATGPSPTATSRFPGAGLTAAEWDALQIPVERRVLLPQLGARPGGGLLPGPRGRHRVAAARSTRGPTSSPASPCSPRCSPTSRRSWCGRRGRRRGPRVLPGPHRRLLRAGRPAAPAVAGLRRRPARPTTPSTSSSPACGPGRRP